jgi:hypothetical protein
MRCLRSFSVATDSELQYTEVLSKMPLITVEKIGESDPVPLKAIGNLPLSGIRAFGAHCQ